MQATRRDWLAMSLALGAAALAPARARAGVDGCDGMAGEKLSFLVPYPAGGGYDTYSRLLASAFERLTGAEVAVSNLSSAPIGAKAIRDSKPDGRTVGILHGGEVLIRRLLEGPEHPDLFTDYTMIGQVANTPTVWIVSAGSGIRTIDDLMDLSTRRPVVVGVRTISIPDFVGYALIGDLAGFSFDAVAGYKGTNEIVTALIRGDIDLAAFSAGSIRPFVESGEIRPILQLSDRAVGDAPFLDDVPLLAGPQGWLVARGTRRGLDAAEVARQADVLATAQGQPRIIVAPAGLEPAAADCLRNLFMATVADPTFIEGAAAAQQPLDPLPGEEVAKRLEPVGPVLEELLPIVRAAQQRVRA